MNMFLEILQEAKEEVLQEAWDRYLLAAFRSTKYPSTGLVVDNFQEEQKISKEDFYKLKRIPHYTRHYKTRIPRFIAAYLPALNDRLYDSKMTDDELIVWMRKFNLDTESSPSDMRKSNAEGEVRRRSRRELSANTIQEARYLQNEEDYGRKWSTVKAVRSK